MFYTFGRDQRICDRFDLLGEPFNNQHLQAVIMIQVNVQRGEEKVIMGVLKIRQLVAQHADVVVVDQGQSTHDLEIRGLSGLLHQFVPDEIAKRFGPICVAPAGNQVIELLKQVGINRDANPAKFAHAYSEYRSKARMGNRWHAYDGRATVGSD